MWIASAVWITSIISSEMEAKYAYDSGLEVGPVIQRIENMILELAWEHRSNPSLPSYISVKSLWHHGVILRRDNSLPAKQQSRPLAWKKSCVTIF